MKWQIIFLPIVFMYVFVSDPVQAVGITPASTEDIRVHPNYSVTKDLRIIRKEHEKIKGFDIELQGSGAQFISLEKKQLLLGPVGSEEEQVISFTIDVANAESKEYDASIIFTSQEAVAIENGIDAKVALTHKILFSVDSEEIFDSQLGYVSFAREDEGSTVAYSARLKSDENDINGKGVSGMIIAHIINKGNVPLTLLPDVHINILQEKNTIDEYVLAGEEKVIPPYAIEKVSVPVHIAQIKNLEKKGPVEVHASFIVEADEQERKILSKNIYTFIPDQALHVQATKDAIYHKNAIVVASGSVLALIIIFFLKKTFI